MTYVTKLFKKIHKTSFIFWDELAEKIDTNF